ncbi:MAG TPA: hypothetical protein DCR24_07555 [Bacillus bacterium]|nr:hypothetical protein [Bacillus sp. (in: firmicutes)]
MKNISLSIILLLMAVAPALAVGEEQQAPSEMRDFSFFVDTVAGPEKAEFGLVLRNNGDIPLSVEFPTSQKYEITVLDSKKNKVYQYSEGRAFAQVIETLVIKPKETVKWKESWDYSVEGKRIKEGEYTVIAKLKATAINREPITDSSLLKDVKKMYIPGENPVFMQIKAEGSKGEYKVNGEARPIDGKFYYSVEDGHNELIRQTEVALGSKYPEWKSFTINLSIPSNKLPQNGSLILNLYERSKESGEILHTFPVLLERFNAK